MKLRSKALVATVVLAAVAAAGGVAYATDTLPGVLLDAQGRYHACVWKFDGDVRVVTDAEQCKKNENRIVWNQAGVQGPQGPQGDAGPQGLQGPPGVGGAAVETFESDEVEGAIQIGSLPTGIFVTLGEPGTYWVFAKGLMQRDSSSDAGDRDKTAWADCELELDFMRLDTAPTMRFEFDRPAVSFTVADVAQATRAGQRLKLVCRHTFGSEGAPPMSLFAPRIYALKVA